MATKMMQREAIDVLRMHAYRHDDTDDERFQHGFLGSLRPYRGLREENFHEVMAALTVVAPLLRAQEVPHELFASLWGICQLGRAWCRGMLRENDLITDADAARLEEWVDKIQYATTFLLDGVDPRENDLDYKPPKAWQHYWANAQTPAKTKAKATRAKTAKAAKRR